MSDVCVKRKIRNFVLHDKNSSSGFEIFVKERSVLNETMARAYENLGVDLGKPPADEKDGKKRNKPGTAQGGEVDKGRALMCKQYFDVRCFGAVMSTGPNAGQVRGPTQITFSRSIDPVVALEHSITRMAVTTEKESEAQGGENRTMGRKNTIPYGLYRAHGFVSPQFAAQTKFSDEDLSLLWKALKYMFELDRSAARGLMSLRKLIVFKHSSELGNAPAHTLFDGVTVERKASVKVPRQFSDYTVSLAKAPEGVECMDMALV